MTETVLRIKALRTWLDTPEGAVRAVDAVDLEIRRGEIVALVGESGCGKSIMGLSLVQLLPEPVGRVVGGQVWIGNTDLLRLPERAVRAFRGRRVAMIFQEPHTSLNPVLTIGEQVGEVLPATAALTRRERRRRVVELLTAVGISDGERRFDEYPHQLSGGMKQRVMIATALAAQPELLIADEPTTALDVTIQAQILALLRDVQARTGMAILLITHDLAVVGAVADRVAVMYAGEIIEEAPRAAFVAQPLHPYARLLQRAAPGGANRGRALEVIPGSVPSLIKVFSGCRFAGRCDRAWELCRREPPEWTNENGRGVRCHLYGAGVTPRIAEAPLGRTRAAERPQAVGRKAAEALLTVEGLRVHFPVVRGVLRRATGSVKAVDGVSFAVGHGRTVALVGESGCGKTTVGRALLQLVRPTAGSVRFGGQELTALRGEPLRRVRQRLQIVFQDPNASLNPRMLVGESIAEGLRAFGGGDRNARRERVDELLEQVGLPREAGRRYPHEFSGGQRQRIAIARALAVRPRLIVCDEPTSALDMSVQAQILNLLAGLQRELGLGYLFITHNISAVEYLAHEVAVMYLGRIVEQGSVEEVLASPRHPYTRALLAAVPRASGSDTGLARVAGDIPSPSAPPSGCHFHPRCPAALARCRERYPEEMSISATHVVRCHLYTERETNNSPGDT